MDLDEGTEYVLVTPHGVDQSACGGHVLASGRVQTVRCATPFDRLSGNLAKLWFEQIGFPRACRSSGADLAFVPYFAPPLSSSTPVVATIHDLIPLLLPQYRGSIGVRAYMSLAARATRRARVILADSAASRDDIVRLLRIPAHRVRVVYLATDVTCRQVQDEDRLARVQRRYGLPPRYLLYFGGFDVRKNVGSALRAYAQVSKSPAFPQDVRFVIAGRLPLSDTPFSPDPRLIAEALSIRDRVVFTGWVDERDKAVLYSMCLGFVFPSEYEGFGLPPLEALSCGVPVITSDVSSLPEVVGDAAIMVSPSDVYGLAQAMLSLVSDPALRERLVTSGLAQARSFCWSRTAEGTLAGFREATRAPERGGESDGV